MGDVEVCGRVGPLAKPNFCITDLRDQEDESVGIMRVVEGPIAYGKLLHSGLRGRQLPPAGSA